MRLPAQRHGSLPKGQVNACLVDIAPVIRSTDWRFFHDLKKVLKGHGRLRS